MPELRILALDAALANTGYALFTFNREQGVVAILTTGVVKTEANADTDTRVRVIIDAFEHIVNHFSVNCVIVEEPAALYTDRFGKVLLSHVGSLMKVVAACYAIVGYCHVKDIFCRTVYPSSWQQLKPDQRKRAKQVSMQKANGVLKYLNSSIKLSAKDHEHVADAINVGVFAIQNLSSRKWAMPDVADVLEDSSC